LRRDTKAIFGAYRDALPPGSYLAMTHLTNDFAAIKADELTEP
jgi:hypothetical protein